jgi:hypothetical protein
VAARGPDRFPGRRAGHPGLVTDPEAPRPDDENDDDETPAFDIDLEPEDQGTAEAADEPSS